ncbi:hypothetical protein A3J90_00950 [candidate division WOR-1 bacterium RIFOXYC2_FULL_37_10]|uniref:Peptidase C39-like domain-containing protein n=1 Tax=candidate division WOR-1 bacterium RIFOXYB2_FULL_37_13 TaxID=1802579 RepID=A0A1F4STP0_UNCSA|nr:MAG: hypothetical protein A2246_04190 [candidate division WOR-1 bacterium RIFOXYA2_FULL_37_7]OGC23824.1 MAG: hypothetical protein A2310_04325 [candidate division WOR-1 bacterium RIFOXYB2_FULL_37_13]OGC33276.1 MAG: hypothetical protein A3J90_00950 [candidate division WOR-1 bacterium RIFOXYC2_FULL_37_10]
MLDKLGSLFSSKIDSAPASKSVSTEEQGQFSFLKAFGNVAKAKLSSTLTSVQAVSSEKYSPYSADLNELQLDVPNLIQGKNECGPTSLAMVLGYYGKNVSKYHDMFISDTVGHGPIALRNRALERGMVVKEQNNGSISDLVAMVDKGIPPMVLGLYGGKQGDGPSLENYIENTKHAHWMVVTGYKKDENGNVTDICFNNPNKADPQCWDVNKFKEEFWNDTIIPGCHRYYMAMAPKDSFQAKTLHAAFPTGNKYSEAFERLLNAVNKLEKTFYTVEAGYNKLDEDKKEKIKETAQKVADKAKEVKAKAQEKVASTKSKIKSLFS